MKESKLLGTLQSHTKGINQNAQAVQMIGQNANRVIGQITSNLTNISIYIDSVMEYDKRYWIIPKGFFPGNKLFAKIYNRRIDEVRKAQEDSIKKQQEAMAEMRKRQAPAPSGVIPKK